MMAHMTTTQNTSATTNSFGFPIEVCSRCNGTGEYSNDGHHSRCYKCNGARTVVKPKAKVAWLAFVANVKSIQQPTTETLVLNTKVRQYNDKHGEVKEVAQLRTSVTPASSRSLMVLQFKYQARPIGFARQLLKT